TKRRAEIIPEDPIACQPQGCGLHWLASWRRNRTAGCTAWYRELPGQGYVGKPMHIPQNARLLQCTTSGPHTRIPNSSPTMCRSCFGTLSRVSARGSTAAAAPCWLSKSPRSEEEG